MQCTGQGKLLRIQHQSFSKGYKEMIQRTAIPVRNDVAQYIRTYLLDPHNTSSDARTSREVWYQLLDWIANEPCEDTRATRADVPA